MQHGLQEGIDEGEDRRSVCDNDMAASFAVMLLKDVQHLLDVVGCLASKILFNIGIGTK